MVQPVLVIHGGAGWGIPQARLRRLRQHLHQVCEEVYAYLHAHPAVDTVVRAVARLEDDPLFNAGTGSVLQRDGRVRMSAAVMDGARGRFAGVLNIERVRHPVEVACALLKESDRVLAGAEATRFARKAGYRAWSPVTPARLRAWRQRRRNRSTEISLREISHGTVGAVALDRAGRLAAATSTGGKPLARAGRVSDSGMPVGNFADERVAVSCTGLGEDIMEEALAVRLAQQVADGRTLPQAFARTFRMLRAHHRRAGAIGLDREGRVAFATTLEALLAVGRTGRRHFVSPFRKSATIPW